MNIVPTLVKYGIRPKDFPALQRCWHKKVGVGSVTWADIVAGVTLANSSADFAYNADGALTGTQDATSVGTIPMPKTGKVFVMVGVVGSAASGTFALGGITYAGGTPLVVAKIGEDTGSGASFTADASNIVSSYNTNADNALSITLAEGARCTVVDYLNSRVVRAAANNLGEYDESVINAATVLTPTFAGAITGNPFADSIADMVNGEVRPSLGQGVHVFAIFSFDAYPTDLEDALIWMSADGNRGKLPPHWMGRT